MPEFRVGDVVQFKEWDEMCEEFEGDNNAGRITFHRDGINHTFIDGMRHLCGTTAVIASFYENNHLYVDLKDFSTNGDTHWGYHIYMLKPFTPPPPPLPWDKIFYNNKGEATDD